MFDTITTAKTYLKQCGDYALKLRSEGKLVITFKNGDPNNVLTNADIDNTELAKVMFKPFTDAGGILINEEFLPTGTRAAIFASGKPILVIDPIDGTRPFSKGEDSWGVMLTLYKEGKPVFAGIYMPSMGLYLTITPEEGLRVEDTHGNKISTTATLQQTHISKRVASVLKLTEALGLPNLYAPSAAEVTISFALKECILVAMPFKAGFWDIAPIAMLIKFIKDAVMFFASEPHVFLSIGPDMFDDNWQLRDDIVITTRDVHARLYPTL